MSKTISLEQYKATLCNDAEKTGHKYATDEKDACATEIPSNAKVRGPYASKSNPRQSKTVGLTPSSARLSAAHNVRGTYMKPKSSKCRQHPSTSSSSSSSLSKSSATRTSKKVVDSELFTPKMSTKTDASIVNSSGRIAVDAAASFSRLFAGTDSSASSFLIYLTNCHLCLQ